MNVNQQKNIKAMKGQQLKRERGVEPFPRDWPNVDFRPLPDKLRKKDNK